MMIGTSRVSSSLRRRRARSSPLIPGSIQSSRIKSGTRLHDHVLRSPCIGRMGRIHARPAQCECNHVADGRFVFDDQEMFLHVDSAIRRSGALV